MKLWTYREIKQKVEADLDLLEETFITPDELVGYCNEAIHEAESEILKIHEDYFLASTPLPISLGVNLYSLPAGIFAQKIRGLQYSSGSIQYAIKRIRGENKFDTLAMIDTYGAQDDYQYLLLNSTAGAGAKIRLSPPSRETSSVAVTLWYIRNAQTIPTAADESIQTTDANTSTQLDTVIDIPEFATFIIDFMKAKCLAKDSDPRFEMQVAAMEKQRSMMVETLTQQVPDDDDRIMMDFSFYDQMS